MNRRSLLLAFGGASVVAACVSVDTEQTTTINAVVETVDPNSRELLVRGDSGAQSGRLLSMVVSPRVQRLAQIRPGDHVTVTYYQAIAAQVVNVFSPSAQPPAETASVYRGETASRPNGEATRVRRGRVTITAVDPATSTVSFIGPNRMERTVTARNPQVQGFIRQLRPGQQVDLVYEEALAISVEPMR
jgi:hypothetical protein